MKATCKTRVDPRKSCDQIRQCLEDLNKHLEATLQGNGCGALCCLAQGNPESMDTPYLFPTKFSTVTDGASIRLYPRTCAAEIRGGARYYAHSGTVSNGARKRRDTDCPYGGPYGGPSGGPSGEPSGVDDRGEHPGDRTQDHPGWKACRQTACQILVPKAQGQKRGKSECRGRQCVGDWSALCLAVSQQSLDLVERLLKAGADPNDAHDGDWSALRQAVDQQSLDLVELLLKAGADPNDTPKMPPKRPKFLRTPPGLLDSTTPAGGGCGNHMAAAR